MRVPVYAEYAFWRPSRRAPAPRLLPLTPAQAARVVAYLPLVRYVLRRHFHAFVPWADLYAEIESAAYFGLCLAAQRYGPSHGAWNTYAHWYVWGSAKRAARDWGALPAKGGMPTDRRGRSAARLILDHRGASPPDVVLARARAAAVARVLDELRPRESLLLSLVFGLRGHAPHTHGEVAALWGITHTRVKQMLRAVKPKLRRLLAEWAISPAA